MKANMNPAVSAGDTAALAVALTKAATFAPPGYPNWASIAKDGAKAAKGGDLAAAKAACRSCHDQYKKKYKASDLRPKKI
jgi:cytochrome c553